MKHLLTVITLAFVFNGSYSQSVGINYTGAAPNASSALDINVSGLAMKKGILIPRVTMEERIAMSPLPSGGAKGLLVFQTNGDEGFYYNTSIGNIPSWTMLQKEQPLRWDFLLAPNGNLLMAHGSNTTAFSFEGLTTGTALKLSSQTLTYGSLLQLSSNSTAGATGFISKMLDIYRGGISVNDGHLTRGIQSIIETSGNQSTNVSGYFSTSGADANTSIYAITSSGTATGIYAGNSSVKPTFQYAIRAEKMGNTGTGTSYGIRSTAKGTASTNIGGYFEAKEAVNNYGIIVPANSGRISLGSEISSSDAILSINDGHFQSQQSFEPSIQANINAGTLAGASIAEGSSDVTGTFSLTGGTGTLNAGTQLVVTFNKVYSKNPRVILTPANASAATKAFYVTATINSFTLWFTAAGATGSTYTFNYMIMEN